MADNIEENLPIEVPVDSKSNGVAAWVAMMEAEAYVGEMSLSRFFHASTRSDVGPTSAVAGLEPRAVLSSASNSRDREYET